MRVTVVRAASLIAFIGALVTWTFAKAPGASTKTPVLIELFTSEGCSSCPPADRLLEELDEKQPIPGAELIVLSEHVDYWNSEGWVDPYSSRIFSARQQSYADQLGLSEIYTPQVIVDGQRQALGSNGLAIKNGVEAVERTEKVALEVSNPSREGNRLKLHLASGALPTGCHKATFYIALAENKVQSKVSGGENGGRSLTHVAVVRVFSRVGTLKAGDAFSQDVTVSMPSQMQTGDTRLVAILQDEKSHRILGAVEKKI